MAARKKTTAKRTTAKKAVKKKVTRRPAVRRADSIQESKNAFIIIGGIVAIILFVMLSVMMERSKDRQELQQDFVNLESSVSTESAE